MTIIVEPKTSTTKRAETITWADKMALSSPTDTISTSTWTGSDGLTIVSNTKTDNTTSVVVSGGRTGAYCLLHNHIVCASTYEYDETIVLEIVPT